MRSSRVSRALAQRFVILVVRVIVLLLQLLADEWGTMDSKLGSAA